MSQSNTYRRRQILDVRKRGEDAIQADIYPVLQARYKALGRELRQGNLRKKLKKFNGDYELSKKSIPDTVKEWAKFFKEALIKSLDINSVLVWNKEQQFFQSHGFDPLRTTRKEVLDAYFARDADTRISDISTNVEKKVNKVIADWFNTDESLPQLIDRLGAFFDENHARVIATTELAYVASEYARTMMNDYGIELWQWDAFDDAHTCDLCMDLMVQSKQQPFTINDPMPPDISHPNCRCGVYFIGVDVK